MARGLVLSIVKQKIFTNCTVAKKLLTKLMRTTQSYDFQKSPH